MYVQALAKNTGHLKMPVKVVFVCLLCVIHYLLLDKWYPNMLVSQFTLAIFKVMWIFPHFHHSKGGYYEHVCIKKKSMVIFFFFF